MEETLGNTDQIYEAYKGNIGDDLMLSTRERFTWQASVVQGKKILDIGCSQGILPILLAREGKEVVGMDIMKEAILFALNLKEQENPKTKEKLEFLNEDYNQSNIKETFDTVILGEVIEHLFYPDKVVKKILSNLKISGRIIITVPFGINDYYDHRKTYYLYDLIKLLNKDFEIREVKYSDIRNSTNWIGIVADRKESPRKSIEVVPLALLKDLESNIYKKERLLLNKLNELDHMVKEADTKYEVLLKSAEYLKSRRIVKIADLLEKIIYKPIAIFKDFRLKWEKFKNKKWFNQKNVLGIIIRVEYPMKKTLKETTVFKELLKLEYFSDIRILFIYEGISKPSLFENEFESYPNVRVVFQDYNLSTAARYLKSEFISILNVNDSIPEDLYSKGFNEMKNDSKITLCLALNSNENGKSSKEMNREVISGKGREEKVFREYPQDLHLSKMILRNKKLVKHLPRRYEKLIGWNFYYSLRIMLSSKKTLILRTGNTNVVSTHKQNINWEKEIYWHKMASRFLRENDYFELFKRYLHPVDIKNLYAKVLIDLTNEKTVRAEKAVKKILSSYDYTLDDSRSLETVSLLSESNGSSYYTKNNLNVAILTDAFAYKYFEGATNLHYVSKKNFKEVLDDKKIDIFLFVTCWYGMENNDWIGIAGDPLVKQEAKKVFQYAKKKNIPIVFWSKEDPTNFEEFIDYARISDYIFTTAEECIKKYKKETGNEKVYLLKYGINPLIHNPIGFRNKNKNPKSVLFAGSWYPSVAKYIERIEDQKMLFDGVIASKTKELQIIDRNFFKLNQQFDYPVKYKKYIYPSVSYDNLQKLHKLYDWAINLNIVKDSKTMCAARIYELQAIGMAMISNPSLAIQKDFPNIFIPKDGKEVSHIMDETSALDIFERQVIGIRNMFTGNTVFDRLSDILKKIGKSSEETTSPKVYVVYDGTINIIKEMFDTQSYENKVFISMHEAEHIAEGYITFFCEKYRYGPNYIQDLINGFKFTNVSYVTKGEFDEKDSNMNNFHHYVSSAKDKYRTMYNLKKLSVKRILGKNILMELGYVIDPFEISVQDK